MFDSIAPRYDLLNRMLSARRDLYWRRFAVAELLPKPGGRYLDVATGTGDVALEILRQNPTAKVVGIDFASSVESKGSGLHGLLLESFQIPNIQKTDLNL